MVINQGMGYSHRSCHFSLRTVFSCIFLNMTHPLWSSQRICYTEGVMRLEDFDYHLPPELIAQEPLPQRDESRLMVLDRRERSVAHRRFNEIGPLLPPGCLLVLNDSKVIPARLFCRKAETLGRVEVLLTRRLSGKVWEGLVKPSRRVQPGCRLVVEGDAIEMKVLSRNSYGTRQLELAYSGDFWELLGKFGHTPLPPYIKKNLADRSRYQTIYAREEGSVAAPTAGLHFTPAVFQDLEARGINRAFVTLHVGPGTFRPVKCSDISSHKMESEYYSINSENTAKIRDALTSGREIVVVGTTAVRTLESAWLRNRLVSACEGSSDLFIYPGFPFQVTRMLITNFHLPCSTLLMLVSALAGREFVLEAYREAIARRYRFYSLGDAMLVL